MEDQGGSLSGGGGDQLHKPRVKLPPSPTKSFAMKASTHYRIWHILEVQEKDREVDQRKGVEQDGFQGIGSGVQEGESERGG